MKNKIFIPFFMLLVTLVATSCSDDDGLHSKELKVYVRAGETLPIEATITHTPVGSVGDITMNIPLRSTRPVLADATVTFSASEALLEQYNKKHETSYELMPESSYTLSNNGHLTLKEGQMQSETGLSIEIPDYSVLTSKKGYLLPIEIEGVDSRDKGVEASSNLSTIYLIVHTRVQNIDDKATSLEGTPYDRTGWNMIIQGYQGNLPELFDGDITTEWSSGWGEEASALIINMQETKEFSGIRIAPQYYWGRIMCQKDYEVFVSDDGKQWSSEGTIELAQPGGTEEEPEYQYIKFYAKLKAQYIKLKYTSKYGWSYTFTEVDVFN